MPALSACDESCGRLVLVSVLDDGGVGSALAAGAAEVERSLLSHAKLPLSEDADAIAPPLHDVSRSGTAASGVVEL